MIKLIHFFIVATILLSSANAELTNFEKGKNLYNEKKYDLAKFKFEQDIVFNPKNEKSYLYLSKIFHEQKNKKLEEKNLNTVILLNPKNEEATYNLAKLKLNDSDFEGSKKLIENLLVFCKEYCQKSENLKTEIEKSLNK